MRISPAFPTEYYSRSLSVLETALREVATYRMWQAFDPGKGYPVDIRYAAMPALTKKDIREHFPHGMLPRNRDVNDGLKAGEIEFVRTSGTSDVSVTNIWNQKWWDTSERASWRLNAHAARVATGTHREAILANPVNVGLISDDVDLPMEKRRLSRFLYLNEKTDASSWSAAHMDRMIRELEEFRPAVLEANPSLLARLCRYANTTGKRVFQPEVIVFTYEYPTNFYYRHIRQVFNTPIASSYGTTETGYVFLQCEEGRFHQNSESCRVDFQPLEPEHGGPYLGRILVTTFNNPWYYIVHFDVGDLARLDEQGKCPCGRDSGLVLSAIEGRSADVTLTCEGRLVSARELDNALSPLDGVDEYRLDQLAPDSYELHLVSARTDKRKLIEQASEILMRLYGKQARVSIILEDKITLELSGKHRIARASFAIDMERYLDRRPYV